MCTEGFFLQKTYQGDGGTDRANNVAKRKFTTKYFHTYKQSDKVYHKYIIAKNNKKGGNVEKRKIGETMSKCFILPKSEFDNFQQQMFAEIFVPPSSSQKPKF